MIPGMVTNEATILACTGKSMYVLQVTHKSILLIKPVYNDCAQQWKPSTLGHESSPSHMEITHASSATGGTDGGGVLGAAVHQGYIYSVHILLWGSSGIRHIGELEIKNKVKINQKRIMCTSLMILFLRLHPLVCVTQKLNAIQILTHSLQFVFGNTYPMS